MRELRGDDGATEITIISGFDLLFQSLRNSFGDISEFDIFCRIIGLNEVVETSKGKIIRTLDSVFSRNQHRELF
jgi:hypothetical protein